MIKYKIGDIAEEISIRENDPANSGYERFVGLEHYVSGDVEIHNYGTTEKLNSAMKVFQAGDILIARRNVYLRRAAVVNFDGLTSGDSIVLRVKDKNLARILPFVLNSDSFWDFADQYSDGTMSKRLSPKTLKQYEFELPDKEEQEKYAELLWAAYRTKRSYEKLLVKIDDLVKSQFIEMFGLPENNLHSYEIGTIGDVVSDVHYGTAKKASEDGKYVYLRMNNITYGGELDLSDIKHIDIGDKELSGCLVMKGDVLFNRTNSRDLVGKTCAFNLETPMVIAGYIIRLRTNGKVTANYISEYLNLPRSKKMLLEMAKGAVGQANINAQEIQSVEIIIPPEEAQLQYERLKEQSDKSKFEIKQAIDSLNATIRALVQRDK